MKRLALSIVILVFVAALCTASVIVMKRCNDKLFELVQSTAQAYRSGKDAQGELEKLMQHWKKHYLLLTYVTSSATMEDMARTAEKLPFLLEAESDDFLAELNSLAHWSQLVYDSRFPDLSSVF